jgi:hypothetical protein
MLKTKLVTEKILYTGKELRPHYLLSMHGVQGSGLIAFEGGCLVETDALVDWEDRMNRDSIRAKSMVHFMGEFFGMTIREGVWLQRLLIAMIKDDLEDSLVGQGVSSALRDALEVYRDGDDIFVEKEGVEYKISVSIVTASPVSVLLHIGINLNAEGAPVSAIGLEQLGLIKNQEGLHEWASRILSLFEMEWKSIDWACAKVRPVL